MMNDLEKIARAIRNTDDLLKEHPGNPLLLGVRKAQTDWLETLRKEQSAKDAYDVFGTDEKGRPPLLARWQDEREAEELAQKATRH